jgi:nudix-type nucleoside diphosphatase (YffH/AdpP family)
MVMEYAMAWTILDKTLVYDGWGRFLLLDVEVANGVVVKRQLDDHGSAACVLAYNPGRRMALLASQPRVGPLFMGLEPRLAEAAAGMFDAEESGQDCARREAMEELGVRLTTLEPVGCCWSAPGVSTETIDLYLGAYDAADRVAEGGGVEGEHEDIEILEVALPVLWEQALAGAVSDMKTLLLIYALHARRPELFS